MTAEIVSVSTAYNESQHLISTPILYVASEEAPLRMEYNWDNYRSPCQCYQDILNCTSPDTDILIYMHNDVVLHDDHAIERILSRFRIMEDPAFEQDSNIVAVGLGGAISLGNKDLYRKPYNIWNLARSGYASNQDDAEIHGERFTGSRRVAVLDAFCMAVRTDWLRSIGGWPTAHLTHHCLDLWLACMAARHGKQTWMTGAACLHKGGGTSIKADYQEAKWLLGGSTEKDHELAHKYIFNEFRDVLPISIPVGRS